jgi:integral membrane sensor domain MASE1
MTTLGTAGGMVVAYFLAAQLGLALTSRPSGAAVSWPASGLAVGFLIISGRRAYRALVIGVVIGTLAANLLSDRSLVTATFKGLCNAGEAVLAAWLLERWFGRPFTIGDLRAVAGLLTAAGLATAASATAAAATMTLLHTTAAPYWEVWRTWFLSDGVGIVVAAPLVIGLDQLWREQPSRGELIEGAGVLGLVALTSFYVMNHQTGSWLSFSPGAVVLPLLLWLTARCPPAFPIAGAFAASIAVILATTFGMGRFGDVSLPIAERAKGAQLAITMVTIYTLVLTALFAERRRREAELKQSNNRLQLALDCAELGIWSLYLNTGHFENDVRDRRIHGHGQEAPPRTLAEMRSQVHPDDLFKLDAAFGELGHASGSCRTEYRLAPRTDQERAGRERWVTLEGTVVRRADGRAEQLLGVTRDITERKHAEDALRQREVELAEAQRVARIGSWYWDSQSDVLVGSDELFRIYDFDPATPPADFRREFGRRYSAHDLKRLIAAARTAMQTGVGYELDLRPSATGHRSGSRRALRSSAMARARSSACAELSKTSRSASRQNLRWLNATLSSNSPVRPPGSEVSPSIFRRELSNSLRAARPFTVYLRAPLRFRVMTAGSACIRKIWCGWRHCAIRRSSRSNTSSLRSFASSAPTMAKSGG